MKKKVIIIGDGGHAVSCIDIIENSNNLKIIGIITKSKTPKKKFLKKYKILGSEKELIKFKKLTRYLVLGISFFNDLKKRQKFISKFTKNGFKFVSMISKNSKISNNAKIDEGVQIFNNVIVGGNSYIGKNAVLNNGSIVEHDVFINDNAHISTGVIINGGCQIDRNTFIGSGSILRQNIRIGKNKFIKMSSVIIK